MTNIESLSYADLPNIETFHVTMQKKNPHAFINVINNLIKIEKLSNLQ